MKRKYHPLEITYDELQRSFKRLDAFYKDPQSKIPLEEKTKYIQAIIHLRQTLLLFPSAHQKTKRQYMKDHDSKPTI